MGFTGRTGRSHSQEGANPWTRAEEVGWEFRATGPFHGIRVSTSLARIWERPGSEYRYQRSTRWVSSLDWMSPTRSRASTWSLGATFTGSEAGAFGGGEPWRSLEVRPRIEWRSRGTLRVRAEAITEWSTAGFRAERLEFRMSWSGEDLVPVPWFDGGDAITARVFLDRNLDGRRNAGEPTLEGVAFRIDGTRRTSDRDGLVRFPEAIGMGYRVLLESGSVAADLVSARPFPREIRVPSDRGREIELPFVLAGSVTVRVFQDENRDAHLDPGEPGLEMLRVELTRGGERVVSGVTDDRGVLRFPRVPPGEYLLRIAPGWSPPGWEDTGAAETNVRVEPGEETLATPIGLARVQKPIRRTFQGGRSQNSPRSPK